MTKYQKKEKQKKCNRMDKQKEDEQNQYNIINKQKEDEQKKEQKEDMANSLCNLKFRIIYEFIRTYI